MYVKHDSLHKAQTSLFAFIYWQSHLQVDEFVTFKGVSSFDFDFNICAALLFIMFVLLWNCIQMFAYLCLLKAMVKRHVQIQNLLSWYLTQILKIVDYRVRFSIFNQLKRDWLSSWQAPNIIWSVKYFNEQALLLYKLPFSLNSSLQNWATSKFDQGFNHYYYSKTSLDIMPKQIAEERAR